MRLNNLKRAGAVLICAMAGLGLAACGSNTSNKTASRTVGTAPPGPVVQDKPGRYKVGRSYAISGIVYQPVERFRHSETGQASWYGPGFHGRLTANGERYDQRAMTAAHRTLQMPSIVRVTNLANGRSVVVRVNDRGPYHGGRVLDVSEAAAEALNFKHLGVTKVRIDVLEGSSREVARLARQNADIADLEAVRLAAEKGPTPRVVEPTLSTDPGSIRVASAGTGGAGGIVGREQAFIQAGAFGQIANARGLQRKLESLGAVQVEPTFANGKRLYRVRLGPYPDFDTAEGVLHDVIALGVQNAKLIAIR